MAGHDREQPLGVVAAQREGIGMADTGVRDHDKHLTFLGRCDIDLNNLQGLASLKGHGGTGFHETDSL
jgi:hypothetical protein